MKNLQKKYDDLLIKYNYLEKKIKQYEGHSSRISLIGAEEEMIIINKSGKIIDINGPMRSRLGLDNDRNKYTGIDLKEIDYYGGKIDYFKYLYERILKSNDSINDLIEFFDRVDNKKIICEVKVNTQGDMIQILCKDITEKTELVEEKKNLQTQFKFVRKTFEGLTSPQLYERIISDTDSIEQLKGIKREITVLFSDIRGFTSFSEKHKPEEVVRLINQYMEKMINGVFEYDGTVDKMIGDCIMALYGAPIEHENSTYSAILSALKLRKISQEININRKKKNEPEFPTGIGLHTAEVVVGFIGSKKRFDYTVLGDGVNLASRLCHAAKADQIIITENILKFPVYTDEETYTIADYFEVEDLGTITVKGKSEPLRIFNIINEIN